MTYPFVADSDNFPRKTPVRAITIHMAEGGGTVGYLKVRTGNSCHYVVERSGAVVQMVREDRASGSINPRLVRTTDDSPFMYLGESITYGVTANKAALGDAWRDPNSAVIAIEVEGFAKDGPSVLQRAALRALVFDIRSRYPGLPTLGHRDFQNYKACPGRLIPWVDYDGHGAPTTEEDVPGVAVSITDRYDGTAIVDGPGHAYILVRDGRFVPIPAGWPGPEGKEVVYRGYLTKPYTTPGGTIIPADTKVIGVGLDEAILLEKDVILTPREPDTSGDVNAAVDYISEGYVELGLRIEEARAR